MDDTVPPHPVDDFLQQSPNGGGRVELRQALRAMTMRVLRRRRWWRRAGFAGALAACYVAGLLTMRFALPSETPHPEVVRQQPQPVMPEDPAAVQAQAPAEHESALTLEWRAFESTDQRAELYRLAGNRYLEQEGDMQSALRCYRQALDAGTEESLTIMTGDNWLLMALKEARVKEKSHARNGT